MPSLEDKICESGQNENMDILQSLVKNAKEEEIVSIIKQRVTNSNFVSFWNYLMLSFDDSNESHNKRYSVVMICLHDLENHNMSSLHCNAIITRLCLEFPKFKPVHLINLCSFCIKCIQTGNMNKTSWKELLPELLNVIVEKESVEYNDIEMSGLEYKTELLSSLYMFEWSSNIITPLTIMFIDIELTKEEHFKVVNKLSKYIDKLTHQEIPAFIYQLLKLCKKLNSRLIFYRLQSYFGFQIYNKKVASSETDTDSLDLIESTSTRDALQAESSVLFHIYHAAFLGNECVKDYLVSLKNLTNTPEFVLHPFQIGALLTISKVSHYEEQVFEVLRLCISRVYREEQRKNNSAWFSDMVPENVVMESMFCYIIETSLEEKDIHILQGLINLSFALLGVGSALGRDVIAEKQWQLGINLLIKIVRHKRRKARLIIQNLCNHVIAGRNTSQYIECLHILCSKMPIIMIENQNCIIELMDISIQISGDVSVLILEAILPVMKISAMLRDHLILLLRKALFSRNIETRQMAVIGFLKLLKNMKISNLAALADSNSSASSVLSGHSVLTQISLSRTGYMSDTSYSNEALCLEVLGILRRCFLQQAEVRAQLYKGLYEAICSNPDLIIPALDFLWTHFSSFYEGDENVLPPLKFSTITLIKDVNVTLQEPLAKLIQVIGLIVCKVRETDKDNINVKRFVDVLELLCKNMIKCELVHFNLDDGTDLLDILPESQQKCIILKEVMSAYESLINYKINSWNILDTQIASEINSLFQGYNRLNRFSKNISKPKKIEKKKQNGNKSTQPKENSGESKKNTFKIPETVLDFQSLAKILNLLHNSEVDWTTKEEANVLKPKKEFHRYILQSAISLLSNVKYSKTKNEVSDHCIEIGAILYQRCIIRLDEFADFDVYTANLAVDCFDSILTLLISCPKKNLKQFLCKIDDDAAGDDFICIINSFIDTYTEILENDKDDDPNAKKLLITAVNTLTLLVSEIPTSINEASLKFVDWIKEFIKKKDASNKQFISNLMSLFFHTYLRFKTDIAMFETIAFCLADLFGTIREDNESVDGIKLINDASGATVLQLFCNTIKTMLDNVDWIISRLKAEYAVMIYPGEENPERKREQLARREKEVCCQMCFIINIMNTICGITVPPGSQNEIILKNVSHMFNTLNSLTRYFILSSSKTNQTFQNARFERVVKLTGKNLSPTVSTLILYMEDSQNIKEDGTTSKKKSEVLKNKVLRDTKLFPKMVFEMEQFSKSLIQLSNKVKVDLTKYVGQGTTRDFRILHFKEVFEKAHAGTVSTQLNTSNEAVADESLESSILERDNGSTPPPTKKSRV